MNSWQFRKKTLLPYIAIWVSCILFAGALRETIPKVGLINDEAVEILQSQDLPTDRFYFFTPNYQGGNADIIESFMTYVGFSIRKIFGANLYYLHLFYSLYFCAAFGCFLYLLRRLYQDMAIVGWGSLFFCSSSYALFYNRILTRNGISLLWSTLLLLVIWLIFNDTGKIQTFSLLLCLPLVVVGSLWTYTSYKFLTIAIYMALALHWFSLPKYFRKKRQHGLLLTGSFLTMITLFSGCLLLGGTSFSSFFFRGSYVLRGEFSLAVKRYFFHLIRSLLLPVFHQIGGDFLMDVTHLAYNRQMLSWLLIPFFFIGIGRVLVTWHKKFDFFHIVFLVWGFSTIALAVGGPHLKHHFALFPFVMLLTIHGIDKIYQIGRFHINKRILLILMAVYCFGVISGEVWHIMWKIPTNNMLILDTRFPMAFSQKAQALLATMPKVYIVEGYGRDATRYYTRQNPRVRYLWNQNNLPGEMRDDIKNNRAIGIVIQGKNDPNFLVQGKGVLQCFQKSIERIDQWDVTSYSLNGNKACEGIQ